MKRKNYVPARFKCLEKHYKLAGVKGMYRRYFELHTLAGYQNHFWDWMVIREP